MRPYRKFRLIARYAVAPLVVFALLVLTDPGLAQDPEPNDDFATAVPIPPGVYLVDGCIAPTIDLDFYVFSVQGGYSLSVSTTSASRELFQLDLFDERQQLVASGAGFLELQAAARGFYYLRVSSFGSEGCYRLAISPPPPPDPYEPNDDFATAAPIPPGGRFDGCIAPVIDLDFYSFVVPEGAERLQAFVGSASQVLDLALFDAGQQLVAIGEPFSLRVDGKLIQVPTPPAGEYFLRVSSTSTGCYFLNLDGLTPPGPPVANAGQDQHVNEGSPVTLDGRGSFDPNDPLTYQWVQTAGPVVTLSDPSSVQPTFTAPAVGPASVTLTFALTVSDGILSATDSVDVVVENFNHTPRGTAGADQTRNEGSLVTLDGSASYDPDGDAFTYTWTQTQGPVVTLSDAHHATPTLRRPWSARAARPSCSSSWSVTTRKTAGPMRWS